MSTARVRPATPADFGEILALLNTASLPTQDLGNARPVHFWVAERDGRIDGAGGLEQYGDAALLRSLVVEPASRGSGLGVALVETLEHAAVAMGISRLVLLTREAPLNLAHLRNMVAVTEMGGIVFPPVPAFYSHARTLDDVVNHTVGRVLDLFGVNTGDVKRWTGLTGPQMIQSRKRVAFVAENGIVTMHSGRIWRSCQIVAWLALCHLHKPEVSIR